jgi:hypothetical protein
MFSSLCFVSFKDSSDKRWWKVAYKLFEGIGQLSSVEYDGRIHLDESSKVEYHLSDKLDLL